MGYIQAYNKNINILDIRNRKGDYEAVLTNLTREEVSNVKNNILIDKVGIYSQIYNSTIHNGNKEKNIKVYAVDNVITNDMFKVIMSISKGRLPQKENEILIDNVGKDFLHKNVGDILELGDTSYKIVGIYNKVNSTEPYTIEILTYINDVTSLKSINAVFNVVSQKNKEEMIRKIVNDVGIDEDKHLTLNNLLFYYYGDEKSGNSSIFNGPRTTEIALYSIILILTICMTYGAINISIKERIDQFSILRCIGATPNKIRSLLIRESIFLGFYSLIPGIILGEMICFFIHKIILQSISPVSIPFTIYTEVIGIVVLLSFINIVVSNIKPFLKVGNISPIEGTKNHVDINSKVKIIDSKTFKKVFGYNGFIAYKNIRGNNRSFLVTTIVSIIILSTFIVFSGYSNTLLKEYKKEKNEIKDVTLEINLNYNNSYNDIFEEIDKYKNEIKALDVASEIFPRIEYYIRGIFENVEFNEYIKENDYDMSIRNRNININGKMSAFSDMINLIILDEDSLKDILLEIKDDNIDIENFRDNGVLITDMMIVEDFINIRRIPLFELNEDEKFTAKINERTYEDDSSDSEEKLKDLYNKGYSVEFKYLGSVNISQIFEGYGFSGLTTLIVSRDFYDNNKELFVNNNNKRHISSGKINFDIELKDGIDKEEALRIIENYSNKMEMICIDNELLNSNVESNVILMSSMIYLVIFLVMIVGGLNLINSKYMSIKLRGKEIGTLLAIGINKKRLKKILILEGVIQWIITIVISLTLSYIILTVMYKIMTYTEVINTIQPPILEVIIGSIVLFIINIIGVYIAIRKLEHKNTTELIRNKE